MLNAFISLVLPPLLVFGVYHLMTWFNLRGINQSIYWRRLAMASAISHVLLAAGFFVFSYFDYQANRQFAAFGLDYADYLFNRSEFWRLMTIFDTIPMLCILGLFWALDRMGLALPGLVPATILITIAAGTIQWYFAGGAIGALLERFWSGLKTTDEEFFS